MESSNEKMFLLLEDKETKETLYQYEIELLEFQKETLSNEEVSFYYTFKDIVNENGIKG